MVGHQTEETRQAGVIDSHQHFWKPELFYILKLPGRMEILRSSYGPEDLEPLLDAVGVDQTILVQTYASLENTYEFLDVARSTRWVAGVVGWVDLGAPDLGNVLDSLQKSPKFKGVRHQWEKESDPAWALQDPILRGLRELERRELLFELLVKPPQWPYIARVADAVPDLPLVIDHIGKPKISMRQFDDWAEMVDEAASRPLMWCKLSGMITEADWDSWRPIDLKPYVSKVLESFGSDRVMYGSDWPVCLLAGSYIEVFDALQDCLEGLTNDEKARILGGNAKRFYRVT